MKKTAAVILCSFLSLCCFAEDIELTKTEDLRKDGIVIGADVGSSAQIFMEKEYPEIEYRYLSLDAGILALRQNKIDGFVLDDYMLRYQAAVNKITDVKIIYPENTPEVKICAGISRETEYSGLRESFNEFLKIKKADGTLDRMTRYWIDEANTQLPEIEECENPKGVLVVGTTGIVPPQSFYTGDTLTGFDIELAELFGQWAGYTIEFKIYDFGGIVAAASEGIIDLILTNFNYTEERAQVIDYSDPYFIRKVGILVKNPEAKPASGKYKYETFADLKGKKIAIMTGTVLDSVVDKCIENPEKEFFDTMTDCFQAVVSGKVAATLADRPYAQMYENMYPGKIKILDQPADSVSFGFAGKKGNPVVAKVSAALEEMRKEGLLDEICNRWIGTDESAKVIPEQNWEGKNGKIIAAGSAEYMPVLYVKDNKIAGFDAEILLEAARRLDMKVEFVNCKFSGLPAMLSSGKADLILGGVGITEERKKTFDFTIPYCDASTVVVVKNEVVKAAGEKHPLRDSFVRNFITESRWKLLLSGLEITIIISVCSLIFGLLLGFGLCMIRRSRKKVAGGVTLGFIRIIQGMPTVVLLMILYYVIFGAVDIPGVVVAIIGFSINFGAYSAEIMLSGMNSVDKGQIEASYALGYSKAQTFWKIVFPQAAVRFIPVLKGEFISMVKMTSIVGYIAVSDLTKASDIIRSRTMEAFFPLIMTAVIYFILAWLLTQALVFVEKHINPKGRKNILKGIEQKKN